MGTESLMLVVLLLMLLVVMASVFLDLDGDYVPGTSDIPTILRVNKYAFYFRPLTWPGCIIPVENKQEKYDAMA